MFCTFIFAVLFRFFLTVSKPLTTVTYYLMAWLSKPADTLIIDVIAPKNPSLDAKISQISLTQTRVIAIFVPNFVAMATWVNRGKCNWQHLMAQPPKPPIGAKILQKSLTQAKLKPILSQGQTF